MKSMITGIAALAAFGVLPAWSQEDAPVAREQPSAEAAPVTNEVKAGGEGTPLPDGVTAGEWFRFHDGTPEFFKRFLSYHAYKNRQPSSRVWKIQEDGTLYQCPYHLNGSGRGKGASERSFLVSADKSFGDFELEVVMKFGASGGGTHIYYRADPEDKKPFVKGFEYQVTHPDIDIEKPKHRTGALSDILEPMVDTKSLMKRDDWNTMKIRAIGNVIEHYLNGTLVLRFDITTDAFKEAVAGSRRGTREGWGQLPEGSIGIGDSGLRGAQMYYKEIRIRKLSGVSGNAPRG
ncbi:MAG: 3-keto-disaccharide hydrolase [Rhizobiaceae bacterium]